ncbi:MAG TPA: Hsp70 family protein, partial [Acidimicrobiales bacterium]
MSWTLAIDFGTTATAAAVYDGDVELIHVDGLARLPSLVLLGSDGAPIVGAAAERQAPGSPERVERAPKRRLGDRVLLLGDGAVDPVDLVAAVLRHVAAEARRRQGGTEPMEVILTHPAAWVGARLAALREAARRAELGEVTLLPEPVAAAVHLADDRIAVGDHVAVYDLGGGTFDAAVLRRTATGFEPVGAPGGDEHLGGEDFDELLYDAVGRVVAARDPEGWRQLQTSEERTWVRANAALREAVRAAKEALSSTPEYTIYVAQLDAEVRVTREELEELIRPALERTVDELEATIERAGLRLSEIKAVYLVGGSSRLPLAARLVSERTQLVPLTWGDPKAAVALGAARRSGQSMASPVVLAPATAAVHVVDGAEIAETVPADAGGGRNNRNRLIAGTAVAVAVALVAFVLTVVGGGDDDNVDTVSPGSTTTTAAPGELRHSFPSSDADGVRVARSWLYSSKDGSLQNDVTVTNLVADAPKALVLFEVVPKEVASTIAAITFDPPPTANVQDDPVVRYDLTIEPGGSSTLSWTVALDGDVDAAKLESLAASR